MRYAGIYLIKNKLVLCSSASSAVGGHLSVAPYIHLPEDANDDEIVSAINKVMDANQYKVPHPKQDEWSSRGKNHLKGLGLKTYKEQKEALHCSLADNGESFIFSPSKKEKVGLGSTFVEDALIEISKEESNEKIAAALRAALDICKQNNDTP